MKTNTSRYPRRLLQLFVALACALAWTLNAVWTLDSVLLLFSGWIEPNGLGYAFVIGQAVIVGVFAELEIIGIRRATTPLAA